MERAHGMDCPAKLLKPMRHAASWAVVGLALSCSRRVDQPSSSIASPVASQSATHSQPAPAVDGGEDLLSVVEVDALLAERYGAQASSSASSAVSVEQAEAIKAADAYVDNLKTPITRPRRYIVRKTASGWNVTVFSLEDLRHVLMERRSTLSVQVVEEGGRFRGVSTEIRN